MLHKKRFHRIRSITHTSSGFLHPVKPITTKEKTFALIGVFILGCCFAIVPFAKNNPSVVEEYFSLGFYQLWAGLLSSITSLIPFSIAEIVLILFGLGVITFIVTLIFKLYKHPHYRIRILARFSTVLCVAASIIMTLFTLGCLPNYYRYEFTHYSNLEIVPTTVGNLVLVCEELVDNANIQREDVKEDQYQVATYAPLTDAEMAKLSSESYDHLIAENPQWEEIFALTQGIIPKPVVFSRVLSYAQILGFFFPYTIEANINVHTSDMDIPSTMCHELAHISGFMREDEANFIAFLACSSSDDPFIQYSGTLQALVHSTNALYRQDTTLYSKVMTEISPAVRRDLDADSAYYQAHDTKFGDFSRTVNDTYLKVNNQTDGVNSYGRMVDLLIADYNQRHGK